MKHRLHQSRTRAANIPSARYRREGGYLLLAIMLMMVFMIIAATVAAPKVIQQMKRDREEEMIHRGTEYARAIKKFYKKNGRYPASLDDLDKGQVKYLRKRYKDPLTKDGKWKLLNYADIATLLNSAAPGTPAAAMGTLGGSNSSSGTAFSSSGSPVGFSQGGLQSQQQQQQQQGGSGGGFPSNSDGGGSSGEGTPSGGSNFSGSDSGFSSNSPAGFSSSNSTSNQANGNSNNQQGGTTFGSNSSNGQTFGGGAIVGVGSLSKDPTIRIYNKKKTYNEWQFIYNPMMDQNNVLLRGPYQPTTIGSQNIGTPASQMNGQQNQNSSPFGQPSGSGFGQTNGVGTASPQPTSSP
jgi:type II secretory pathway pseudopilin PulG